MKKKLLILVGIMVILISSVLSYFAFVHKSKSPEELQQEKYWSDVNRGVEKVNKQLREKGITLTTISDELLTLKYDMSSFIKTKKINETEFKNYLYISDEVACKDLKIHDRFFQNYSKSDDCQKIVTVVFNTTDDSQNEIYFRIMEFKDVESVKEYFIYVKNTPKKDVGYEIKNQLLMTKKLSKYILIMDPYSSKKNCDFDNYTCPYQKFKFGDEQTNQNRVYIYDVFSRLDLV